MTQASSLTSPLAYQIAIARALAYLQNEFEEDEPADFLIGLTGRSKRDADAKSLKIVHIEDNR